MAPHGDLKKIFFNLSRKIVPNGTIYKNLAGVSGAFRIVNPVAIAEICIGVPTKGGVRQGAEQLILHRQRPGGR
jgi:hypothetical protein